MEQRRDVLVIEMKCYVRCQVEEFINCKAINSFYPLSEKEKWIIEKKK